MTKCMPCRLLDRGDAGTGGKAGSLWLVGSPQLLAAAQGQTPPTEASFKLKQSRFRLGEASMRLPTRHRTSTPGSEMRYRASTSSAHTTQMGGDAFLSADTVTKLTGDVPSPPPPGAGSSDSGKLDRKRSDGRITQGLMNTSL